MKRYYSESSNCIPNHSGSSNVSGILNDLTPGTNLNSVLIDGVSTGVTSFVAVNKNLAFFTSAAGNLVVANVKNISSIEF